MVRKHEETERTQTLRSFHDGGLEPFVLQKPSVCEEDRGPVEVPLLQPKPWNVLFFAHLHGKCEQLSNHEALDDENEQDGGDMAGSEDRDESCNHCKRRGCPRDERFPLRWLSEKVGGW